MSKQLSRKERAEHLYRVIVSERFLTKQGLGNEVPFFICPYTAAEGLSMVGDRADLIERIILASMSFRLASWKSVASLTMCLPQSLTWRKPSCASCCKVFWMSMNI